MVRKLIEEAAERLDFVAIIVAEFVNFVEPRRLNKLFEAFVDEQVADE